MAQGYSIFSQAQGPVVPVSLYSDAATQGIAAGKNLPTQLTSAITGTIEGVKTGLDIQGKISANAIAANQVEQIPTANRIQNAQAATQEAYAKITENKALVDAATQANEIDQVNSDLEQKAAKAKQDLEIISLKNQFQKEMASTDAKGQVQVAFSPKYQPLYSSDAKFQEATYLGLAQNPYNGLTPEQRTQLMSDGNKAGLVDADAKRRQQASFDLYDASGKLAKNSVVTNAQNLVGQPSTQLFLNNLEEVPPNVQLAPDGKTILTDSQHHPLLKEVGPPDRAGAGKDGKSYAYVNPVTKKKTLVVSGVLDSDDFYKTYGDYTTNRNIVTGASLQAEIAEVDRRYKTPQPKTQGAAQSGPVGDLSKIKGTASSGIASTPLYVAEAQQVLNTSEPTTLALTPELKSLNDTIVKEASDPAYRGSPAAMSAKKNALDTLGRELASSQFKESPAIQKQYTVEKVIESNKSLVDEARRKLSSGFMTPQPGQIERMIALFTASTPEELYYKQNLSSIQEQLKFLQNTYAARANGSVVATAKENVLPERFLSKISGR